MTIQAIIGGEEFIELATNKGYGDFVRWVDSIPVDKVPLLSHLVDWGWVNDLSELEKELANTIDTYNALPSVKKTAREFLDNLIKRSTKAETVMITDGLTT